MAGETDYMGACQSALQFTLNALPLCAGDRASDVFSVKGVAMVPGVIVQRVFRTMGAGLDTMAGLNSSFLDGIRRADFYAQKFGCGNCYEHASVVYMYLRNRGIRPITFLGLPNHALVLAGNDHRTDCTDPSTFPQRSWVCDAWKKIVYPGPSFARHESKQPLPMYVEMD